MSANLPTYEFKKRSLTGLGKPLEVSDLLNAGLALLEEGEVQQAQTALETALSLVSDRQERLILLGDYTRMLAQQEQWSKVLQRAKEALRLVPNDPSWLAIQQLAQGQLARPAAMQALRLDPSQKLVDPTALNPDVLTLPTELTGQAYQTSFPTTLQADVMIPMQTPNSSGLDTLSIFVSHSTKDNDFVTQLVQDLRHAIGKENAVWYDAKGGLLPGDPWFRRIEEEIAARDIFLIILSHNAMNSDWVRREYDIALNENRRIIPVLYQHCTIWGYLKTIQYTSFLPPKTYESALSELLTALRLSLKANREMGTS